jgi:hypothetical protein
VTLQSQPGRLHAVTHVARRLRQGSPSLSARIALALMLAGAAWLFTRMMFPPPIELPSSCGRPAVLAHHSDDVAAATRAADRGFCGIEVDVQWRPGVGLVVAHDPLPDTWTLAGSLTFTGLLDSLPQLPELIWLDFKNLSRHNAIPAAAYVNAAAARYGLKGRLIVEARRPGALWLFRLRANGVIPAYWIPYRPHGWRTAVYDARLMLTLGTLGFPAISIPRGWFTPSFAARFRRFAVFTWTTITPEQTASAASLGARIILTDVAAPPGSADPPTPGAPPAEAQRSPIRTPPLGGQ